MDNNKNRKKDRPKSNPELRKMEPKDHATLGMEHGHKVGTSGNRPATSHQHNPNS